jgi:hypothetical protein
MRSTLLRKCLCGGIAMLFGPSLLMAITVRKCPVSAATPESYKWNFPQETSALFQQMMERAFLVQHDAERLQILQSDYSVVGWQGEVVPMERTVSEVNAMNEMLCRLRQIARVDNPWQRHAINRITPKLIELADYTQTAMDYLNTHQEFLFASAYNSDINGIYARAVRVRRILRNAEEHAGSGQVKPFSVSDESDDW